MSKFWLSKSTYIRSLQCQKSLYLNKFHKDKKDPIPPERVKLFQEGTNFGLEAQKLFPGGKDATPEQFWNFSPSIKKTQRWIESDEKVIYEAAFQKKGVLVALDILVRENDKGWHCFEVKKSSSIKPVFLEDAALQYFIINSSGLNIIDFSLILYDAKNTDKPFSLHSVLDDIISMQTKIPDRLNQAYITIKQGYLPNISIGNHCNDPYECDFKGFCNKANLNV